MKPLLKFTLCIIAGIVFISTQCKAQSSNAKHAIDSLKITDADEIAICKLYDDAVTEYLKELKQYNSTGTKPTPAQMDAIGKEFKQRQKDIQPQIDNFKKKATAANYQSMMSFAQFCSYESIRMSGAVMQYQKAVYKSAGTPASH